MGPPIAYLSGPDDHSLWAPDEQAKGYLHLGWSSTTSQSFHYNGRMFSTPLAAVPLSGTVPPPKPPLAPLLMHAELLFVPEAAPYLLLAHLLAGGLFTLLVLPLSLLGLSFLLWNAYLLVISAVQMGGYCFC